MGYAYFTNWERRDDMSSGHDTPARQTVAKVIMGRERKEGECVKCGKTGITPDSFTDDCSRREYNITRFCQACQDEFFAAMAAMEDE